MRGVTRGVFINNTAEVSRATEQHPHAGLTDPGPLPPRQYESPGAPIPRLAATTRPWAQDIVLEHNYFLFLSLLDS